MPEENGRRRRLSHKRDLTYSRICMRDYQEQIQLVVRARLELETSPLQPALSYAPSLAPVLVNRGLLVAFTRKPVFSVQFVSTQT